MDKVLVECGNGHVLEVKEEEVFDVCPICKISLKIKNEVGGPRNFNDSQKYPEGEPPGKDITEHLDYLKEHGFRIVEGYFDSNDWYLYWNDEHIQGHTYGADQIRHVWELVNGYDRNAVSVVCPNCKEKVREDAISYCINCSDTKKICLLCCSDVYEMYCKECGEKER